jgi:cardiolipin synthase (CMP-forming)
LVRLIPNLISIFRLCLVPFVLRAIWNREYEWALAGCFAAGLSDALDGLVARRFHAQTRTGALLDPLADKLLLSGVYLMLGYDRVMPWWLTGVVIGRDFIMLLFFIYVFLFTKLRDFPPTIWGKLCTVFQIFTALAFLLSGIMYFGPHELLIKNVLAGVTVALTAGSAIHYFFIGMGKVLRSRGTPAAA